MNIYAAERRRIEDGFGQDQPVGGDHSNVCVERGEIRLGVRGLQTDRVPDIDPALLRKYLHG
jgi:hypothetical protein